MLEHVSKGNKLEIKADTWNRMIDATRQFEKKKSFGNIANSHKTEFYVQNKTGKRLPIYSVVMITDLSNDVSASADEDANLNEFIAMQIVFKGEIPDINSPHFNKTIITQEPLEIDAVGVGKIEGITKCNIFLEENSFYSDNLPSFVRPETGNTDYLLLANYGSIETVFSGNYKKSEVTQAVINLGGAVQPNYFLVDLVWKSGGDSDTDYSPRIYDIFVNNTVIKTDVDIAAGNNPYRRPQDYNITKANIGMAFFTDSPDDVLIAWANEYPLIGTAEVIP